MQPSLRAPIVAFALLCTAATATSGQVRFLDETFDYDRARPDVGAWIGDLTGPDGTSVFVSLVVETAEGQPPAARMILLEAGALGTACQEIERDGSSLALALPFPGGRMRFVGEISHDGQRFAGTAALAMTGQASERPQGTFELARTPRPADLPEPLAFTGTLAAAGMEMEATVVLARTPAGHWVGHLDIPAQMLREFPLVNVVEQGGRVEAHVPVPGGATVDVAFDETRRRITGRFLQSGLEIPLDFALDDDYAYRELPRPQHPKPPFPYRQRDVVVPHPDGFELAGTLTLPAQDTFGAGPYPAAILISGSGQQDRDETLLGHKPFLVIADHLTRHGIAVMRYDDRGVGGSGGAETLGRATSADFATDALAVLAHVRGLDEIDPRRVGLIGHSEGGIIAPMVGQASDHVAWMILLAGTGVTGRELLVEQNRRLQIAAGIDEAAVAAQTETQSRLLQAVVDGAPDDELAPLLRRLVEQQLRAQGVTPTETQVESACALAAPSLSNAWMRYFLAYDPLPALRATTCPVLAVNGTLDMQVWHGQNLDAIERAMDDAGRAVTAIRYEGLNHLFQPAKTGAFTEYVTIETTFDERVLADLVRWIEARDPATTPRGG